jgi:hypothetical protein
MKILWSGTDEAVWSGQGFKWTNKEDATISNYNNDRYLGSKVSILSIFSTNAPLRTYVREVHNQYVYTAKHISLTPLFAATTSNRSSLVRSP